MTKKYSNILFDMDGVLINSMKYHLKAWQLAFKKNNINTTQKKIKNLAGYTSIETIQIICNEHKIKPTDKLIQRIKKDKAVELDKIFKVKHYPNVISNIKKLKKLGCKIALVSGAKKYEVEKTNYEDFHDLFDLIISGDDVKFGKPNPEPYQKAIDKLKIKKENTVIIEDAPSGIQSAHACGIDVLSIPTTFEISELKKYKPTKIFENHQKLFKYLIP